MEKRIYLDETFMSLVDLIYCGALRLEKKNGEYCIVGEKVIKELERIDVYYLRVSKPLFEDLAEMLENIRMKESRNQA